ncbi:MAG: hypothetical protein KJ749_14065 [Planctomycetes bacterium]|nr:hypothetical protein [Planctomycetota bacterium]
MWPALVGDAGGVAHLVSRWGSDDAGVDLRAMYEYDSEDPGTCGTDNHRLMKYEVVHDYFGPISTVYYHDSDRITFTSRRLQPARFQMWLGATGNRGAARAEARGSVRIG